MIELTRSRRACVALLAATALHVAAPAQAQAPEPNDKEALAGLKEVKVAFDLTTGDGKALLMRLNVIDETRQSLIKQGITPHIVIAFRGPATRLVQTDESKIKAEDRKTAGEIAAKIKAMSKAPGMENIEQCAVAIRGQETKVADVLPEIKVVGNSWVSLIAYQAKGYAYINP